MTRFEHIKRYTILDADWLPGGDELIPTMKLNTNRSNTSTPPKIEAMCVLPMKGLS